MRFYVNYFAERIQRDLEILWSKKGYMEKKEFVKEINRILDLAFMWADQEYIAFIDAKRPPHGEDTIERMSPEDLDKYEQYLRVYLLDEKVLVSAFADTKKYRVDVKKDVDIGTFGVYNGLSKELNRMFLGKPEITIVKYGLESIMDKIPGIDKTSAIPLAERVAELKRDL